MRRRLTDEEREIRNSRGLSLRRVLPVIVLFFGPALMAMDHGMFERCLGHPVNSSSHGRGAAIARMVIAIPCTPYYPDGSLGRWLVVAGLLGALLFAVPQLFWIRRHKRYWDRIRARETERRAEKRAKKVAAKQSASDHSNSTMT